MLLQNKTSVVTGGARGIGLATAQELAAHGSNIVLADLDAAALGRAAETLQTKVVKVVCDVTSPGDVDALWRQPSTPSVRLTLWSTTPVSLETRQCAR